MLAEQNDHEKHKNTGVIAAGGPETVDAGLEMLKRGGNAVDAAVAAAFASFIAEIGVVHLGGSGIAHIHDPHGPRSVVYDFFSDTPGLGREDGGVNPLDFRQVTIDFGATTQDFHLGRAAVAVPGNIFGLCLMAVDFGRLPLRILLEPAIKLAREGVAIAEFQAKTCELLTPLYTNTESMRQIFLHQGRMIQAGERLFIPHLAGTLEALAEHGAELMRRGSLAQAVISDQKNNHGLLTAEDLQHYQVTKLPSIRLPYHEFEILLPPPSSTGGVLTAFTLKLLAHFKPGEMMHGSSRHLRLLYEVMAATSRARPFWDRRDEDVPVQKAIARFLGREFVQRYVTEVQDALHSARASAAAAESKGPANTSHLSVIDGEGMTVSLTTTAGESAGYVVPETGFIPNNMMGEEDLHPLGFHSRPPGTRIPTMMTPTIVLHNDKPRLVVGSGGSARIRSAIMQVLSNLLDFHMALDQAVNVARVHIENGVLQCEAGYDQVAVGELESLGYPVNRWQTRSIYFGGAHSVSRTADGRLFGAGDTRRGGSTGAVL